MIVPFLDVAVISDDQIGGGELTCRFLCCVSRQQSAREGEECIQAQCGDNTQIDIWSNTQNVSFVFRNRFLLDAFTSTFLAVVPLGHISLYFFKI